jgi:nicotinamidase/pyrazinamidase
MPPLKAAPGDIVMHKAVGPDGPGYSGFELTDLEDHLRKLGVTRLGVSGIATEYCVRATALDGLKYGFEVVVLTDLIRAVRLEETANVLEELRKAGAKTSDSAEWLKGL